VDYILHQAALASVSRSLTDPVSSHARNVNAFLNMLLAARQSGVKRFVYASSSSFYGDDPNLPKREPQIGRCLSPQAITNRAPTSSIISLSAPELASISSMGFSARNSCLGILACGTVARGTGTSGRGMSGIQRRTYPRRRAPLATSPLTRCSRGCRERCIGTGNTLPTRCWATAAETQQGYAGIKATNALGASRRGTIARRVTTHSPKLLEQVHALSTRESHAVATLI
jgi:hypothetical protein